MSEASETVGETSAAATTQETPAAQESSAEKNGENQADDSKAAATSETKSSSGGAGQGTETKLYVGNLPDDCEKHQLKELFCKYGEVTQCDRVKNFAFVHMLGQDNAKKAIDSLDDTAFMGTHIQVQLAKSKGKPAEDECFHCGKHGHWAKDCPNRKSYGGYDRGRYQPYSRDSRPSPYGGRREPYGRPPPPRDYYGGGGGGDYRSGPPSRDYYSQYRSRSPGYTYEGYGAAPKYRYNRY